MWLFLQNASPDSLCIVFSGPETRMGEIPACSTCTTYSFIAPVSCPEKGPIVWYSLPPGAYDVVVQSISDKGVTPWMGRWELLDGDEYSSCFFIVVQ